MRFEEARTIRLGDSILFKARGRYATGNVRSIPDGHTRFLTASEDVYYRDVVRIINDEQTIPYEIENQAS